MLGSVIRFVRLPWLLLLIWAIARFCLGIAGFPYAPRGNAMFSIVGLTFISCLSFGAFSYNVGGFDRKGTALVCMVAWRCTHPFPPVFILNEHAAANSGRRNV